ncbi:S49 family peptidase [Duganella vulcania]|uniref:S49 family peptidase n=1 Tax=Duganella vulcania TaxID=2692166 RepID=A0A845GRN0_9BURK|nr:S49 family peptidase [Duganella vulcania]MYM95906.1 S49 family peptidase [Duganella vulcania]
MTNRNYSGHLRSSVGARVQSDASLLVKLVDEIAAQRKIQEQHLAITVRREKHERRWRIAGRVILIGTPTLLALLAYASSIGLQLGPIGEVVGVVHIDGEISATSAASADRIIPVLKDAFESANVKQVVLAIDSPGGAPVEAERISQAISALKKRYPKQVVAAISNIGASAAYLIALHTDVIMAGKYSLVGSVGAVISPWQVNQAMDKLGVSQRIYASGRLKAFLNPFIPVSPEAESKAQELVDHAGGAFLAELVQARGRKLKQGIDYATGEVWSGTEAKELGLIDAVGTVDDLTTARGTKAYNFGPHASSGGLWGRAFAQAFSEYSFASSERRPLQLR